MSFPLYLYAKRLQELMVCHDRASEQIDVLNGRIDDISKRMKQLVSSVQTPGVRLVRLEERMSIYEWMRNTYNEYRIRKWTDIQALIHKVFGGYRPHDVNEILLMAIFSPLNHSDLGLDGSDLDSDDYSDAMEELDSDDYSSPLDSDDDEFVMNPSLRE